jgi:putative ABC transport system permease protein
LYGLIAYSVRQRTREFGIRMAMGATTGQVASMVIRKGMLLVAAGVAIGVILAGAVARVLGTLLFGIGNTDPLTFVGVAVILATVALVACYLPARRASRLDPTSALRYE